MDRPTGPTCPRCGPADAWPLVYGLPGRDSPALADRKGFVLGGCLVVPDNPTRECQACDHRWRHQGDEPSPDD